ncbi:hypothetical protein [Amycolatopsis plumensis]|uniref:hypothetical protein n=1 Tax=Amycolatopsis plumensis TaxID=236508 RepID=UPI00360B756D
MTAMLSSMTDCEHSPSGRPGATPNDSAAWRLIFHLLPSPAWGIAFATLGAAALVSFACFAQPALGIAALSAAPAGAAARAGSILLRRRREVAEKN